MDTLQKSFEKLLKEHLNFPLIGALIIKKRLGEKGVLLNKNQMDELEKELQTIGDGKINFDFDLDDKQKEILGLPNGSIVKIDLSDPEKKPR